MTIPYVRTGEKLHLSANTLNTIANHINNAPSISAGKPIKGGGGGGTPIPVPVVQDNTPDIFKITKLTDNSIIISGGTIINGDTQLTCNSSTFSLSGTTKYYYFVKVEYSSSGYSVDMRSANVPQYPTNYGYFRYTLGSAVIENGEIKIEQWHSPAPIYIHDRWF